MITGLGLLSGCIRLSGSSDGAAKSSHVPRVGYLTPTTGNGGSALEDFRQGLRDHGYVEGESILIELRSGPEVPEHAIELVNLPVDVIVAVGLNGIPAIQERSCNMPIVTMVGSDALQAGLVASLAHPGGYITGLSSISDQLSGKRLALLHEAAPGIRRVGAIWNPETLAKADEWRETEHAAQTLGLEALSLPVRSPDELKGAFEAASAARIDALLAFQDQVTVRLRDEINSFTIANRLPSTFESSAWVVAGGLMSYGPNQAARNRRAADFVDRILKGANPAEMPIEQATVFDLTVNLKTAQSIGLTLRQSIQSQATELIQ